MDHNPAMETIDRIWLQKHLGDDRGARAEIARVLGITPDKVSRILSGVRKIQAEEVTVLVNHFAQLDQKKRQFDELWDQVSEADRDFLINAAEQLRARNPE